MCFFTAAPLKLNFCSQAMVVEQRERRGEKVDGFLKVDGSTAMMKVVRWWENGGDEGEGATHVGGWVSGNTSESLRCGSFRTIGLTAGSESFRGSSGIISKGFGFGFGAGFGLDGRLRIEKGHQDKDNSVPFILISTVSRELTFLPPPWGPPSSPGGRISGEGFSPPHLLKHVFVKIGLWGRVLSVELSVAWLTLWVPFFAPGCPWERIVTFNHKTETNCK